jgi:hypothetical protein
MTENQSLETKGITKQSMDMEEKTTMNNTTEQAQQSIDLLSPKASAETGNSGRVGE